LPGLLLRRADKGFPALPLEEYKRQWKERGIRRRFHLTISGCLGLSARQCDPDSVPRAIGVASIR